MEPQTSVALPLTLALELVKGETLARRTLTRDEAAELAAMIASDLHALIPKVGAACLTLAGTLLDAVELLRPGFPIWAALDDLARRLPRGHCDNVLAFGSHDGQMPEPVLEPSAEYADGPLRLLPMSLLTPPDLAVELSECLEDQLIACGEAGKPTADWLMRTLGMRRAHVRYLSRNDVLAVMCVQYGHVALGPLWELLEVALLTPEEDATCMTERGLTLEFTQGAVLAQSPAQWLAERDSDDAQRAHDFAGIIFELHQYALLLDAHRVPLQLLARDGQTNASDPGYLLEMLSAAHSAYDPPALFAHEAPGLGVVAISVAQRGTGGIARVLAQGFPLRAQALAPLLAVLAHHYAIPGDMRALGRVWLDANGGLGAPATALH